MKALPVNIRLPWGTLEALHWSNPGAPKVLCLHGWLDNAASFVPLSAHLTDFDLLALDFAGHGFSSHRPASSRYYFPEYMFDVDAVLDILGWEKCHLIGHSMGGGIAAGLAAAIPERVDRLVSLDAVGVLTLPPGKAARQLRLSMKSVRKDSSFLRPYESVEEAILARQKASTISDEAARLICERSLEHTGDYYQWRTDPRLNWRSPWLLTDDQILNILAAVRAPMLAITSPSLIDFVGADMLHKRLDAITDCTHITSEGDHHFHMEEPASVGAHITEFLLSPGSKS